jgi:hypothetical protein
MSTIPNSSKTCGRRTKRESRTCLPGQLFLLDLCASGHFCFPFLLVVFVVRPHRPTVCPWCRTTYQRCCICSTTTLYIQGIHHVKQQQQGCVSVKKKFQDKKGEKLSIKIKTFNNNNNNNKTFNNKTFNNKLVSYLPQKPEPLLWTPPNLYDARTWACRA